MSAASPSENTPRRPRFEGATGLARIRESADVEVDDAASFVADFTRVPFGRTWIETFRATPHRLRRRAVGPTDRGDAITAGSVVEGNLEMRERAHEFSMPRGSLMFTRSIELLEYTAAEPVFLLRSSVGAEHFPPHLITPELLPSGPIPVSTLTKSFVAFIRQLAIEPPDPAAVNAAYLARALADLQIAVITRVTGADPHAIGPDAVRFRITEHIADHLTEVDLGPRSIAAALGVSLRYVHQSFNTDETSVARYIRDRRLDGVVSAILGDHVRDKAELAARFGFSGRDQLNRAFRDRFGTTIAEYRRDNV